MVDQIWMWIADSIDCTDDNSFSAEKMKLHWFDLKKFMRKKTVTLTIKSYQRLAVIQANEDLRDKSC